MPTYVYRCENKECGKTHEFFQRITEEPLTLCPNCKQNTLKRIIPSSVSLQFKGSGFYITDYDQKGSTPPNNPPKNCGKNDCGCKG